MFKIRDETQLRTFESKRYQLASGFHGPRVWGMQSQEKHDIPPKITQALGGRNRGVTQNFLVWSYGGFL